MHNIPQNNLGDIVKTIAAFLGAITGSIAFIWKILDHLKFELDIYSHYLSVEYSERASKAGLRISKEDEDLSIYSDNAVILNGWFKLLLRMEGKRYRNHRVQLFTLEPKKELKKLFKKIMVNSSLDISLFCDIKDEYPQLSEGLPKEVNVHSNPIFLKAGWKNEVHNPDKIKKKIVELIDEKYYSINIHLTTYKYPFTYVRGKNKYFRRERFIKRFINALRRLLRI